MKLLILIVVLLLGGCSEQWCANLQRKYYPNVYKYAKENDVKCYYTGTRHEDAYWDSSGYHYEQEYWIHHCSDGKDIEDIKQ